jgi:hypothetical protein
MLRFFCVYRQRRGLSEKSSRDQSRAISIALLHPCTRSLVTNTKTQQKKKKKKRVAYNSQKNRLLDHFYYCYKVKATRSREEV